jgi:hypothetical protein
MTIKLRDVMFSSAALALVAGSVAGASPSTVNSFRCNVIDPDGDGGLSATIKYTENSTGRRYDYQMTVKDGTSGTATLRDAAGRTVATASAQQSGASSVKLGPGWNSQTHQTLAGMLSQPRVQLDLEACVGPVAESPNWPWGPWFCPIIVFIPDDELQAQVCGWLYPGYPHPW